MPHPIFGRPVFVGRLIVQDPAPYGVASAVSMAHPSNKLDSKRVDKRSKNSKISSRFISAVENRRFRHEKHKAMRRLFATLAAEVAAK